MQVTHSNQCRQTTTMSEDLLGEPAIKQQQPAHKRGVCVSPYVRGSALKSERKCLRKRQRESESWCESGIEVANKVKYHPHHPSQVN